MGSLRDIRTRIHSVKNTQKITGAMKLVAASKLRRAQEAAVAARPYGDKLGQTLNRVAAAVGNDDGTALHPLLLPREARRVLLVVFTSDRGLCGAFNSSVIRRAESFLAESRKHFDEVGMVTVGKRGHEHFRKTSGLNIQDCPGVFEALTFRQATDICDKLVHEFTSAGFDAVHLLYNRFESAISQDLTLEQLLPIDCKNLPDDSAEADYIFEPTASGVLDEVVPRYVAIRVWRALLESYASEHGARMTAMDSATKNASEMVDNLTLIYNRARQAAITQELMEIVGGAEALSG